MPNIKGTKTEKNLLASFAGESQARNRYTYFAGVADKEGYPPIAAIFTETADQERVHAKSMFKILEGGMVEITTTCPAGRLGTTAENLDAAAAGEHEEHTVLYPGFADTAKAEGFPEVAVLYRAVSKAEAFHERRFRALRDQLATGTLYTRSEAVQWKCMKCGYIHEGKEAPSACPACKHPQQYFVALDRAW